MCLAQGPQRSDAREAGTRGPSVLSHALYHWATALATFHVVGIEIIKCNACLYPFSSTSPLPTFHPIFKLNTILELLDRENVYTLCEEFF